MIILKAFLLTGAHRDQHGNYWTIVGTSKVPLYLRRDNETKEEITNAGYVEVVNPHPFNELWMIRHDIRRYLWGERD